MGLNDSFKQFLGGIELKEDYAELFKMQIQKIFNYMNAETLELQKTQQRRENELNKHFKLFDTNEKSKQEIIQQESEESSIEPNEQESEHGLSEEESEESTDSVEYMKFF